MYALMQVISEKYTQTPDKGCDVCDDIPHYSARYIEGLLIFII